MLSFTNTIDLGAPGESVGFENYIKVFQDPIFWNAIRVTLQYVAINIGSQTIIALGLAVAMDRLTTKTWIRIALLMPWLIPGVSAAMLYRWMLNPLIGVFNQFLHFSIMNFNKSYYFSKYLIWDGAYVDVARVIDVIDNTATTGITSIKFDKPINPSIINYTNNTIIKKNNRILTIPIPGLSPDQMTLNLLGSIPIVTGVPGIQKGDLFDIDPGSIQLNRPDSRYFIKNKTRKLYTRFDKGDSSKFSNTVFRGLKYIYKTNSSP